MWYGSRSQLLSSSNKPILNFLRRPSITARLVAGGTKAKVYLTNITKEQQFTLLHMIVKQVAAGMKMDHRYVLNRLLDLDKSVVKARKEEERQAKYGLKKKH